MIGAAVEFFSIVSLLTFLGYMLDSEFFSQRGIRAIGWWTLAGFVLGFSGAIVQLFRRVASMKRDGAGASFGRTLNREGYQSDLEKRIADVKEGLKNVGEKINRLDGEKGD